MDNTDIIIKSELILNKIRELQKHFVYEHIVRPNTLILPTEDYYILKVANEDIISYDADIVTCMGMNIVESVGSEIKVGLTV